MTICNNFKLCAKLMLGLSFAFMFLINFQKEVYAAGKNYTLNEGLEQLGFIEDLQKETFITLCHESGVELYEEFNAKSALSLVESTQRLFTNRKDKQERWEIVPLNWMEKNTEQRLEGMKILGITDSVMPKDKKYDAICILGAVNDTMKKRTKYVEKLIESGIETPLIVLLSGERYVSAIDGSDDELSEISESFNIKKEDLTEAYLLKHIFNNSSLSELFDCVLINTPRGNNPRPTTKTTVEDLCEWTNQNKFKGKILFISSQPNVCYQEDIISGILEQTNHDFDFEVVGCGTNSQDVQQLIGALGSHIWASMPQILSKMKIFLKESGDIEMAKKLYGNQAWIANLTLHD